MTTVVMSSENIEFDPGNFHYQTIKLDFSLVFYKVHGQTGIGLLRPSKAFYVIV